MKIKIASYTAPNYIFFNSIRLIVLSVMMVAFFCLFILTYRDLETTVGFSLVELFFGFFFWKYFRYLMWGHRGFEEITFEDKKMTILHGIRNRAISERTFDLTEMKSIIYTEEIHYHWYHSSIPSPRIGRFKLTSIYDVDYYFGQNTEANSNTYFQIKEEFEKIGMILSKKGKGKI